MIYLWCPDHPQASENGHVEKSLALEWRAMHKPPSKRSSLPCPAFMQDIRPFVSPVGETPEVISSRSTLREHERKHGVYQCGDIPAGTFVANSEKRKAELVKQQAGITGEWA